MSKERVIVITGPTASGKTELGIRIAKKIRGEIISADSRMVYRGLPIGTAAPNATERRGIRHHCIAVANPKQTFTVDDFISCATRAIVDIKKRGKTPIIVGGTGFYIDALLGGSAFPNVPPNLTLRALLEKKTAKQLFAMLKKRDPERARTIDPQNTRRLTRALEIIRATNAPVPKTTKKTHHYDATIIGILLPKNELESKIAKRASVMIRKGLVAETKRLIKNKVPKKRIRELGFEYRLPLDYIEGKLSKEEMLERLKIETRRYAKRQLTWLKRNKEIRWFTRSQEAFRAFLEEWRDSPSP